MAERAVVQACTRELDRRRAWWVNVHGDLAGRNGVPDLIFCHLGRFGAVETKSHRGRPTKLQAFELEQIARAGGHAIVCREINELRAVLDEIEADDQGRAAA